MTDAERWAAARLEQPARLELAPDPPTITCGNSRHPDGAWHPAEPDAPSWQPELARQQRARRHSWGCSCPARTARPTATAGDGCASAAWLFLLAAVAVLRRRRVRARSSR